MLKVYLEIHLNKVKKTPFLFFISKSLLFMSKRPISEVQEKHPSEMTSRNQIGSGDNDLLQLITGKKREKEESLGMLCEFERQVRAKMQLETKTNDLQGKLQEAMKEASESGIVLQGSQSLNISGVEELKLKLQGTSALADQLQIELANKHKLEMTVEVFKGKLLVEPSIQSLQGELQEREDELRDLEYLNQALLVKERKSNDELVEAREQLLMAFPNKPGVKCSIGIKRMGEINCIPFVKTLKEKLVPEVDTKALELCSYWEDRLRDPFWHPFKIIFLDDGSNKEIIDENDELVKVLKELGDEVYEAVTNALKEMYDYNPSGRYPVPEIWNFKENRKAETGEVIAYMCTRLLKCKRDY